MSAAFSAFYRSTANHDACQAVAPQAGRHEKTGRRRLAAYYCGWTTQSFACVFGHDGEQSVRLGIILGCLLLTLATGFAPARADERLSLVFVGDTGLNASGARVSAEGGIKSGRVLSVDEALAEIDPLLKGDMVFANLETVVTDNNNIAPRDKMFVFRMHPAGARALLRAGINVFSTANNHAMDFGTAGAGETFKNMKALSGKGLLAWPGLGRSAEEVLTPQLFVVGKAQIAISAFGIGGGGLPASHGNAGTLRGEEQFNRLAENLTKTHADLRILSVHYGQEFAPVVTEAEAKRFAELPDGVDIIVGHHAHVARGVALVNDRLILYGLGNFLHFGTQDMARFDFCRDFGLLVKVGMKRGDEGTLALETVEAVPLTGMHEHTKPMTGAAAQLRLAVLNYLGAALDDKVNHMRGLRFDGNGLWCAKGASDPRCAAWGAPPPVAAKTAQAIKSACARDVRRGG